MKIGYIFINKTSLLFECKKQCNRLNRLNYIKYDFLLELFKGKNTFTNMVKIHLLENNQPRHEQKI